MYTESRFFTVTGDHVAGTPLTVEHRTAVLGAIATAHLSTSETTPTEPKSESESGSEVTAETSASSTASTLSDDDLLERAKAAANGEKFTRLWSGDVSTYDSHSEADMALCCLLAFWTGGDTNRMNQLFCRSGLYRGKWDEQHFADGSTYGERTLQRACERTTEHYTPTPTDTSSTPTAARPGQSPTPRPPVPTAKVVHRLTTTEETLEYLEARVSTVEQECERLRDELAVAREPTPTTDQRTNTDSKAGVLARVGRLFR
ncbi:phage NrS-1 polymerase family protein [Halogranum rubrum]